MAITGIPIDPATGNILGSTTDNVGDLGASFPTPGLNGGLNFGLFQVPISAFNPSAYAYNAPFDPTLTQSTSQGSPFDVSLNFNQTAGPGGAAANASLFGGLFGGGGGGANGGAGGNNFAQFDPTITQVYAPPNYSMPLAGLLSDLGAGSEPFPSLAQSQATPSSFRPPVINPLQGGASMNVPAASSAAPSPLTALLGGSLAPNSGAAPLSSQQGSPVTQALSALMPPTAPQGAINSSPFMPPTAPSIGGSALMPPVAPPITQAAQTFPINPAVSMGMQGLTPQQQQEMDKSSAAAVANNPPQGMSANANALNPLQGGTQASPAYSLPGLGKQQDLHNETEQAMGDLDQVNKDLDSALKKADSAGDESKLEGDLAGLNADEAQEDLQKDRYKAAQIGGHKHPYLRALGALGMAFQPPSTVANYINQDAQRKLQAAKFNAEEKYKESKSNTEIDKALLSQNRLREQAAKIRADLEKHRAKTEAMQNALRQIEDIKAKVSTANTSAKNELENAEALIHTKQLESNLAATKSLIDYRKGELAVAQANARAHQQIANADTAKAAAYGREFSPERIKGLIDEVGAHTALYKAQTVQAASYSILPKLIRDGKITKAEASKYMDYITGQ